MSHPCLVPPLVDGIRGLAFGWLCVLFGFLGWCCWFVVWLVCVGVLLLWFLVFLPSIFASSYKSYEAHDGLSEMGARPGARGMTSLVRFVVVSLSVLDCQYPRDPLQPAREKNLLFNAQQICSSCFGSANLGHSASFKSSDGLLNECFGLVVCYPFLILSFPSSWCTSAVSIAASRTVFGLPSSDAPRQ